MKIFKDKAMPMKECGFPYCEECDCYVELNGRNYCNVPMIVSKQTYQLTNQIILEHDKRIKDLEEIAYSKL